MPKPQFFQLGEKLLTVSTQSWITMSRDEICGCRCTKCLRTSAPLWRHTGEQLATRPNQSLEDAHRLRERDSERARARVHLPNNERVPLSLSACTHPQQEGGSGGWVVEGAVADANRSFILCLIAPERILEADNCHGGRALRIHMLTWCYMQ